jgi:hypothetical protein
MRRRSLAILLTICLCAFFTSCGQTSDDVASSDANTDNEATAKDESVQADEELDLNAITLKAVGEANSTDAIASRHKNFSMTTTLMDNDSDVVNEGLYGVGHVDLYWTEDFAYFVQSYTEDDGVTIRELQVLEKDKQVYETFEGSEEPYFTYSWFVTDDTKELPNQWQIDFYDPCSFIEESGEKIVETKDNSDGTISVMTECPFGTTPEVTYIPEGFENAILRFEYVLNKDNLELTKTVADVLNNDETIPFMVQEFQYDVEEPEECKELRNTLDTAEIIASEDEDGKIITVVYDPGTDKEEKYEQKFIVGNKIYPILKDGYSRYSDPEGKEPYKGSDGKSDVTIYALK